MSELTAIIKFAPGGAKRLRALLKVLGGNFQGADKVGTLHDMRFVFLDDDTKLLFATTYDGDWDTYIDDFVDEDSECAGRAVQQHGGLPRGMPRHRDQGLDRKPSDHGGRLVCRFSPNLTVAEARRLEKVGKAVDELLDKIG